MNSRTSQVPQLSQGALADIAFLLLIFFMVATTIVEDTGILVELPQWDAPVVETGSDNVLSIKVNAANQYMVDGRIVDLASISGAVESFVLNPQRSPDLPSSPRKAVISLQTDRGTRYEAYIAVYDAIRSSYTTMRNERSVEVFGKTYSAISDRDKRRIREDIPVILSEADPTAFGDNR